MLGAVHIVPYTIASWEVSKAFHPMSEKRVIHTFLIVPGSDSWAGVATAISLVLTRESWTVRPRLEADLSIWYHVLSGLVSIDLHLARGC